MVGSWPDEQYGQAAPSVALACLELLADEWRWMHRRIETIDLLAQELCAGSGGPWCVPIAILAAAASVAFGAGDGLRDVVWYCAGAISDLACLSLAVGVFNAASLTRRQHRAGADEER